jgi:1-aminocyclopropane-1-carboxylate deaminase/D-cysteine desulfhydrase-like pyridoxal-dependent ACC family enzyme
MKIPLQKISDPAISSSGVNLFVLRLDLTHQHISGNKWYKLKYNLEEIKKQKIKTVLTFGGAYSNHIAATAAAGKEFGFKTIGIIRGDEEKELNATLQFAESGGMKLHFVSRTEYRKKHTPEFLSALTEKFGKIFIIPEGGSNEFGVKGCTEIVNEINIPFDFICSACGTGATISGIIMSLKEDQKAIAFPVLHAPGYIESEIKKWITHFNSKNFSNFHVNEDYDFGKYAKHTPELLAFIERFEKQNNIPLDQVYTGKMMFGIYDLIRKGYFEKNKTIVAVHTGGLQGKLH